MAYLGGNAHNPSNSTDVSLCTAKSKRKRSKQERYIQQRERRIQRIIWKKDKKNSQRINNRHIPN